MNGSRQLRHSEFRRLLDRFCLEGDGKPASTNRNPAKDQNPDGADRDWWLAHLGTCPPHDSPRSIAYLRAYVTIGEPIFYATGIPLLDGYVHPDRGIMKAMLSAGCVMLQNRRFELTDRGRDLLTMAMSHPAPLAGPA